MGSDSGEGRTDAAPRVDSRDVATSVGSDDQVLLGALADGDLGALRQLYDRHAPWLSVRLKRRCNDQEVVADVLPDTFVAVWRSAERYRGTGEVGAWMWGIAIRKLVSRLRTRHLDVILRDPAGSVDWSVSLEDELLAGVEYGDLGVAMAALSPDLRAVIQATVLDGLTTREAARLLGIPQNTVKTRVHRAKAHLRASLIEGVQP
jgi:RNA polymerase sigma-70 factor (ECF subfamily)